MDYLSYSTIRELIDVPHSYVCKEFGLERRAYASYEGGTQSHRIIQAHVVGLEAHPLLKHLPTFDLVELKDRDERCEVVFDHEGTIITGFFDGYDNERGDILEIKTYNSRAKKPTPWSLGKFNRLMQWRIYAYGLQVAGKDVKNVYGVTAPREVEDWNDRTVKVFKIPITDNDILLASNFLDQGLYVLEHLDDLAYTETKKRCEYVGCPFGCESKRQDLQTEEESIEP